MISEYVYELIKMYKENKEYSDVRSYAIKESAKAELKRLGYSVTGRRLER